MHSQSLTQQSVTLSNGIFCTPYVWHGVDYLIRDDVRTVLLIDELFADEVLTQHDKELVFVSMVLAEPEKAMQNAGNDLWDMLDAVCWEAFGLDLTDSREQSLEDKVMDFKQDAGRIRSSMRMAYHMDFDKEMTRISWREFMDLLSGLMEIETPTPIQQAIAYRTAKEPKATKYNRDEIEAFRANKKYFELRADDADTQDAAQRQSNAMASAFAAEFGAAGVMDNE